MTKIYNICKTTGAKAVDYRALDSLEFLELKLGEAVADLSSCSATSGDFSACAKIYDDPPPCTKYLRKFDFCGM